jgi:RNA polymerase sigma factor (sigma-70 family)
MVSDGALIARIGAGDTEALGKLFDRYGEQVKHFIRCLGVAAPDVDDLVQLTFLDVVRAASRHDPAFPAKSWLYGIAGVIVRRHRRSLSRLAARVAAWTVDPSRWPRFTGIGDELEKREAADRAYSALQKLSHKKREVFAMIVLGEVSAEEAAQTLGVPLGTVWTRMHHARRDLRRLLKEPVR